MGRKKKEIPPKKYEAVITRKAEQKQRRKPDYRPSEDLPTVEEAKEMILQYHKKRGDKVEAVQHRKNGFHVTYQKEQIGTTDRGLPIYRGLSLYGSLDVEHSWSTVRWIQQKLLTKKKGK